MNRTRLILAILLAPLVVPVLYFAGMAFLSGYTDQGPGYMDKLVEMTLRGVVPWAYLASYVGGFPLIWLLRRVQKLTLRNCVWSAAVAGAVGGYLVSVFFPGPNGFEPKFDDLFLAVPGSLAAMAVAFTFCVIAGIRMRTTSL